MMELGALTTEEFPLEHFLDRLHDHAERDISYVKARDVLRPVAHRSGAIGPPSCPCRNITGPCGRAAIGDRAR